MCPLHAIEMGSLCLFMEKNINLLPLFVLLVLQIYQCDIDLTAYVIVLEKRSPLKNIIGNLIFV